MTTENSASLTKEGDVFYSRTCAAETAKDAERLLPLQGPKLYSMDSFTFDELKYQKRRPMVEKDRDRQAFNKESREHIEQMALQLSTDPYYHLEPISLAQYFDREYRHNLVLVDGHHRYKAYQAAGRKLIPARQIRVPESVAEDLAYILNQSAATLGVSNEQKLQQVWELVLARHKEGNHWENGWTGNQLARTFGNITSTVKRMVKRKNDLGEGYRVTGVLVRGHKSWLLMRY